MEYIVLYLIAFFPVLYYDFNKRVDANNRYLIFEWLCIVCLMGFRYHVGGDSYNYEYLYKQTPSLSNIEVFNFYESKYAFLWNLFTIICKTLSSEFWTQQIIISIFINLSFFYFFKKHVRKYFTAIFIYILLYMFKYNTEVLRASMSVAFFLISFDYLINKKWLVYYIFCIIAFLFHYQSYILFFLPIIHLIEKSKINLIMVFLLLGIVYALIISVTLFPVLQNLLAFDSIMSGKLEQYGTIVETQSSIVAFLYNLIVYYFPVCVLIWLRRKVKDKYNPFLLLYVVFGLMSMRWSHITGRLDVFFILIVIASFVNQLSCEIKISRKLVLRFAFVCLIVMTFVNTTLHLFPLVYPYHSIFNPIDEPGRYYTYQIMVGNDE